jgi:predicted negative regulator of RcsB-dependent stress response
MATHLDLEEQEQMAQLRALWNKYGSLATWVLALSLAAVAAFNGWNWWQREQGAKAAGLFDELESAVQAKDLEKTQRAFADLKSRFPSATYSLQGGLLAAQLQLEKGKADDAAASLSWVADKGHDAAYQSMAGLRLAAVRMDQKKWAEALQALDQVKEVEFEALREDRRGDIHAAQGQFEPAVAAYRKAYSAMDGQVDYRRLVEAKLTALGAAPEKPAAQPAAPASGARS